MHTQVELKNVVVTTSNADVFQSFDLKQLCLDKVKATFILRSHGLLSSHGMSTSKQIRTCNGSPGSVTFVAANADLLLKARLRPSGAN